MGYFEDRFRTHAVHQAIANCLEIFKSHQLEDLDENLVIAINRCEHVVKFAKTMLNSCDADLVNPATLAKLHSAIENIANHWKQFVENRDWNILTSPCDTLLAHIAQLSSKQRPIPKSYSDLLSSLRDNTAKMLRQIREAKQQQDEEAEEFESRLQDFAQALQTHETEVASQKTRLDSLITDQQNTFSKAQTERSEKFSSFISEKSSDFEVTQQEQKSKFDDLHQQQSEDGQTQIDTLQEHCNHAKEIVGIIGNIGVTGNYQKIANEEKENANKLRQYAIIWFAVMILAISTLLASSFLVDSCNWSMALYRVLTVAVFAAPGVYCATESSKHRKKEQENRKLELELATISPFLEKLNSEEKASAILEKLAPKYFGNHAVDENGTPLINIDPKSAEVIKKILQELVKSQMPT